MLNTALKTARSALARATELPPRSAKVLADPPEGSGLEPMLGLQRLPYLGDALSVLADPIGYARRRYERFGPVSWGGFVGARGVWVMSPEAMGEVLTNRDKAFANEAGWGYFIGPFFNRGVMLLDFEEHRLHRRIMQQAFTRERLSDLPEHDEPGDRARHRRRGEPSETSGCTTRPSSCTLDVATEVFVGDELGARGGPRSTRRSSTPSSAGRRSSAPTCPGGRWHRGLRGRQACWRTTSARRSRPSAPAQPTTCSASCATPRPRRASGSATRTWSTT